MSEFAPKPLPLVERCSAMRAHLQEGLAFRTDLFASLTPCEPSSRLPGFGIVECKQVDNHMWLVKAEFEEDLTGKKMKKVERWYRVTLDEHSQAVPRPYRFSPLTQHEIDFLSRKAVQFAEQKTSR